MLIIANIVFILFHLQVEPVFLPACLNKAIQITSCGINIGNTRICLKYQLLDFLKDSLYPCRWKSDKNMLIFY